MNVVTCKPIETNCDVIIIIKVGYYIVARSIYVQLFIGATYVHDP